MKIFKTLAIITICASPLGACKSIIAANTALQDKCDYLKSGVAIAQLAASFYPGASEIVADGSILVNAYCSSAPVADVNSALDKMQTIITAVRPIASQLKTK